MTTDQSQFKRQAGQPFDFGNRPFRVGGHPLPPGAIGRQVEFFGHADLFGSAVRVLRRSPASDRDPQRCQQAFRVPERPRGADTNAEGQLPTTESRPGRAFDSATPDNGPLTSDQ